MVPFHYTRIIVIANVRAIQGLNIISMVKSFDKHIEAPITSVFFITLTVSDTLVYKV